MSDDAKWTPGPWTVQEYGDDECPTLVLHRGETENRICFMATPGSHGDPAKIEADAYLIAAAPDLAEACEALLADCIEYARINNLHNSDGKPATFHSMRMARAALAKARAANEPEKVSG